MSVSKFTLSRIGARRSWTRSAGNAGDGSFQRSPSKRAIMVLSPLASARAGTQDNSQDVRAIPGTGVRDLNRLRFHRVATRVMGGASRPMASRRADQQQVL